MPFIEWNDRLSVNIASIDRQHRTLINYINQLNDAVGRGNADTMIAYVLRGLATYTTVHFAYEEMLFNLYKYPDNDGHKAVHTRLLTQVGDYNTRFHNGERDLGPELLDFLKAWLNNHIMGEDKAYSGFMLEHHVK